MSELIGFEDLEALVTSDKIPRRTLRRLVSLARIAVLRSVRSFWRRGGALLEVVELVEVDWRRRRHGLHSRKLGRTDVYILKSLSESSVKRNGKRSST